MMEHKTVLFIIQLLLEKGYVDAAQEILKSYKLEEKK